MALKVVNSLLVKTARGEIADATATEERVLLCITAFTVNITLTSDFTDEWFEPAQQTRSKVH